MKPSNLCAVQRESLFFWGFGYARDLPNIPARRYGCIISTCICTSWRPTRALFVGRHVECYGINIQLYCTFLQVFDVTRSLPEYRLPQQPGAGGCIRRGRIEQETYCVMEFLMDRGRMKTNDTEGSITPRDSGDVRRGVNLSLM